MRKKIICFIIIITMFLGVDVYALDNPGSKAGIVIEAQTGKVLYEYNKDEQLPMASMTKLMTYYVFRDFMKQENIDVSHVVTVDASRINLTSGAQQIGLLNGEKIKLEDVIKGTLIVSANDFACVLQQMYDDSGRNMIEDMNKKAKDLGFTNTSFVNVTGLTNDDGSLNCTSPSEMARLAANLLKDYPDTLEITNMEEFVYKGRHFSTTNGLLKIKEEVDGLKTGYTSRAGFCMAVTQGIDSSTAEDKDFRVISVVFGCKSNADRVKESQRMLEKVQDKYSNSRIVSKDEVYNFENGYYKGGVIKASPSEDIYRIKEKADNIEIMPVQLENLPIQINQGDEVGYIEIFDRMSATISTVKLYATEDVGQANIFIRIYNSIKKYFSIM